MGAAIHHQCDPGDEAGLVTDKKQSGVRDIPCGSHLAAERHFRIAHRHNLLAGHVPGIHPRIHGHWRVHQSRLDAIDPDAVRRVLQRHLFGHRLGGRLAGLVGDPGIVLMRRCR